MPVVLIGPSSFAAIVGGCGAVNLFHFDFVQRLQFNIMTIFFEDENDADYLFLAQFFLEIGETSLLRLVQILFLHTMAHKLGQILLRKRSF